MSALWQPGDRVKVRPDHYGSGLQGRLGTVLRNTSGQGGYTEVVMDSMYNAGIGIVAFPPEDLMPTKKKARIGADQRR